MFRAQPPHTTPRLFIPKRVAAVGHFFRSLPTVLRGLDFGLGRAFFGERLVRCAND